MLGVFAEFEREMIIDRVINGMERKASKGRWTLSRVPYGFYRAQDDSLIPVEEEIAVVKQIFHLYTRRRLGCRAVATHLNERGLLRRSAPGKATAQSPTRPWSHKTVADVLTNRVYLGEVHFREVIAVDAHDAVIDPATFDLAQQILVERGETPAKKANASSEYYLTGKITCPACTRRYIGTNAYGRSRTYRYYTCWTRNRYGVDHCDAPRIDADALDAKVLDAKVLDAVQDFYTNRLDEALDAIIASRAAHHQARATYKTELATVETQLAAKEEVVDRYLTEYEDNKIDREIIATGTVQERKSMCEALLAELRIDGGAATPVIRIPLSRDDTPLTLQMDARTANNAVRARPPSVEVLAAYSHTEPPADLRLRVAASRREPRHQPKATQSEAWSLQDRLGREGLADIVSAHRNGAALLTLAAAHGVSLSSIKRIVRRATLQCGNDAEDAAVASPHAEYPCATSI